MGQLTADELARDIIERQGVPAATGPTIGAECSARQTAYLFSLIAPERIGRVGGTPWGPRVGHGTGWSITEGQWGRGLLRWDPRELRAVAQVARAARQPDPVREALAPELRPKYDALCRHLVAGALELAEREERERREQEKTDDASDHGK